jgi:LysM repeat protein
MKKFPLFFYLLLFALSVTAQKKDLMIRKGLAGLYIEHKVAAKQSYFSIGRMYNVNPQSIAAFNKIDMQKGLLVDQKLRIPLSDTNFVQDGNGSPLYYVTDDKDHLPDLSVKYRNVPIEKLKAWNKIEGDDVAPGTKLLVGFLKGGEFPTVTLPTPIISIKDPVVVTEDKKPEENKTADDKTGNVKPEVKNEEKPVIKTEEPVTKITETSQPENTVSPEQGYFKSHFDQQVKIIPASKTETVTAGIFKTASGWSDLKYYLLIDKVPPGTIIRIINPTNNKMVYAKVLGEMTGIRQNEGLNIRISNAAASALNVSEQDKFIVNVNY